MNEKRTMRLCAMENCCDLMLTGPGTVENAAEGCVRMVSPNAAVVAEEGRKAYTTLVWRTVPQDFSAYDRLTFRVRPDCAGLQCVTLEIALCSGGVISPFHQMQLQNGVWNTAEWDMTGIERGHVTQVLIRRMLPGRQQNMGEKVSFCFRDMQLEYANPCARPAEDIPEALPWREMTEAALAYLAAHRCGTEVPGVHLPCHSDCFVVHPDGRRGFMSGGWHDRGELSHSLKNTALTAGGLMALAGALPEKEILLREKVLEEARYGLEWLQLTRFGDGYRCVEGRMASWTDGIIGTADDITVPAYNDPWANFCAAAVSAQAAEAYRGQDEIFARYCLHCAREDFRLAYEHMHVREKIYGMYELKAEVPLYGQALEAAAKLYRTTGEETYLDKALRFAKMLEECLNRESCECVSAEEKLPALRGLAVLQTLEGENLPKAAWSGMAAACESCWIEIQSEPDERFFETLLAGAACAAAAGCREEAESRLLWLLGANPFGESFMHGVCGGKRPVWDAWCARQKGAIPRGLPVTADGRISGTVSEEFCSSSLSLAAWMLQALAVCL